MSKVEELLAKYNSNGISTIKLADILDYEQPSKYIVSSSEYDDNYDIPVLTAGQSFILGYTDEKDGVYKASKNNPTIIFDDFTTGHHWVDFDFKIKSSAMKMLRLKNNKSLLRYIFHSMALINYVPTEHSRQWISKYSQFEIPLPHIKVQEEIVKILDSFTNLIDALNEELSLRQKQLEYYRDQLYDDLFKKTKGVDVLCFSELGQIERGKRFVRDDIKTHGQPCIHYGDMYTFYGVKSNKAKTYLDRDFPKKMRYADIGDVIIVGAGENNWDIGVGLAWLGEEPAAVHDACYIVKHNNNPLFIAYYTRTTEYHQQLKKCVSEGKICSFSAEGLGKVTIPIPSLAIQQSIVEKLDAFESLISSLKEEIALRQKQYEYYREKLLTFD